MVNELTREAILELAPPCGCGDDECPGVLQRKLIEWLLAELAKPREERRDSLGRGL